MQTDLIDAVKARHQQHSHFKFQILKCTGGDPVLLWVHNALFCLDGNYSIVLHCNKMQHNGLQAFGLRAWFISSATDVCTLVQSDWS